MTEDQQLDIIQKLKMHESIAMSQRETKLPCPSYIQKVPGGLNYIYQNNNAIMSVVFVPVSLPS